MLVSSFAAMAEEKPLWEAGVGVAVGSFPAYRGADTQHQYLAPIPYMVYRGEKVTLDREGLRGLLFESERWHLDLSVDGMVPAKSDGGLRQGMSDLEPVIEMGPILEYVIYKEAASELRFRMPVRLVKDIPYFANRGVTFHPNLALTLDSGGWEWGGSMGPLFATQSYHDYYYSVSASEATATRPVYAAEAGYSGFRLTMGASRRFKQFWFGGFLRVDNLDGAVFVDSPLVERSDALMAGFVLSWVFKQSERMVQVDH
jgi:outer membrane scaffolding protein for murein synthesis (MipA/OmpV family)